ncbi:MAG: phosphate signaling complex protein PhoU [Ignavibacteriales bacterium]|nr:phosphate signaling complex protein PhoU [Ignavibacteriales bacterium]
MQRHFDQELQELKSTLIKMGSLAEQSIEKAIQSLLLQDKELALLVINDDFRINNFEIEIDTAIVDLLALQQPVASDLRFILAAAKINSDLERIGDHAVNIAQSSLKLSEQTSFSPSTWETLPLGDELRRITHITKQMLTDAINSFIHLDAMLGENVLLVDDVVDSLNKQIISDLINVMKNNSQFIDQSLELIRVSRNLERVADLATNIAEDVVFITKAKNVKHHATDISDGEKKMNIEK